MLFGSRCATRVMDGCLRSRRADLELATKTPFETPSLRIKRRFGGNGTFSEQLLMCALKSVPPCLVRRNGPSFKCHRLH